MLFSFPVLSKESTRFVDHIFKDMLRSSTTMNGDPFVMTTSTKTTMEQLYSAEWWDWKQEFTVVHIDSHLWQKVEEYGLTMFVALVQRHTSISVVIEVGEVTTVVIVKTWLSGAMVSLSWDVSYFKEKHKNFAVHVIYFFFKVPWKSWRKGTHRIRVF